MSRRGVAIGAAIGVFFAFVTPIAQIPASAAASIALRANVPAAVLGTLVNTPPTFGPVYYAAWWVGSYVLGESTDDAQRPEVLAQQPNTVQGVGPALSGWSKWVGTLQSVGKPLLTGALIFACTFATLTYLLVNGVWRLRVQLKRQRRRRRGSALQDGR